MFLSTAGQGSDASMQFNRAKCSDVAMGGEATTHYTLLTICV